MRLKLFLLLILSGLALDPGLPSASVHAQIAAPAKQARNVDESQLDKLPPSLRERGRRLLAEPDDVARTRMARDLARETGLASLDFVLSVFATDPSQRVRYEILDRASRLTDSRVLRTLQDTAAGDADIEIALLALEHLREHQTRELSQLLLQRIEKARAGGNKSELRSLAIEHERWISLMRGTMLPSFMRTPPAAFAVKGPNETIRVLAFGDYGNASPEQKQVALAMQAYNRSAPFDFGLTLGDNFYTRGVESPSDPRWKTEWSDMYDPLGIRIYATLGNHDWGFPDSPVSELLYSGRSPSWRMPAPYYTFTAGPAQFFALDTNEVSEAQLLWLDEQLSKSTATWKIVYGHHPIYSDGALGDSPVLIKQLLPIIKGRADVYLTGHEHDLQHLEAVDGVYFFISGGAGATLRESKPTARAIFAKPLFGFVVLEVESQKLNVKFIDASIKELHHATLIKSAHRAILTQ